MGRAAYVHTLDAREKSMIDLRLSAAALAAAVVLTGMSFAASPKIDVITHAAFFSEEMRLSEVIDPHVFVQDTTAPEAVGPLGIKHAAGLRPALIERDAKTLPLYAANGKALGMTLETWLGAKLTFAITGAGGNARLDAALSGLRPRGHYSLFERHSDQRPVTFTPMGGEGNGSSFVAQADGTAKLSISLAQPLPRTSAVVLIYHSDDQAHGMERGRIGFDAHHVVMTRPE
jgi:hypothetical protein